MKSLLIFPPGWMQFGPYLSLPLLKGFVEERGLNIELLDLNIEFYDWVLSQDMLKRMKERVAEREKRGPEQLTATEYAKVCKALLTEDLVIEKIDEAKATIKNKDLYLNQAKREWAKKTIGEALNLVESAFDQFRLSLNQINFGKCGLVPEKVMPFLESDDNIMKMFYEERVRSLLTEDEYDFIGFSLPAWEQMVPALTLIKGLRNDYGSAPHVCMGGNYITRLVGTWNGLPHPYMSLVDSFSMFEGEESLEGLLKHLESKQPLDSVPNLVFTNEQGQVITTMKSTLDIDTIPTPNFDGLPLDSYFAPEKILPLYTSRSCPAKCSFCTIPYASSKFRERDPQRIVNDLENLSAKYGATLYSFVDETLTVKAMDGLSQGILDRGVDVKWYGETRFNHKIDERLAGQLFAAGCRKMQFGLESYNQRVLNLMRKGTKVDHIMPNLEACLGAGLSVHLFTFLGFPGETAEEANNTYEFCNFALKMSEEKYNNSFSTVGMGAFGLEVYSDVYYHPDRYGVQYNEDVKLLTGDEMFELEYTVESGLSHDEAEQLVREFQNKAVFDEMCQKVGQIRWSTLAGRETNEEEAFLLYCLTGNSKLDSAGAPFERDTLQILLPGAYERSVKMSPRVIVRAFDRNFLYRDGPQQGAVLSFYDQVRDVVVNVPLHLGREVQQYLQAGTLTQSLRPEMLDVLNLLLRNRMIQVEGEGLLATRMEESVMQDKNLLLQVNPDARLFQRSTKQFILFNVVNQNLSSANLATAWLVSLLQSNTMSVGAFLAMVEEQMPQIRREVAVSLLDNLIHSQFVLAWPSELMHAEELAYAGAH